MSGDRELVRDILAGRLDAAEELFERYDADLRGLARSRTWGGGDTGPLIDDVMQDFYEKLCRHRFRVLARWNGLSDPSVESIRPYFARILKSVVIDRARHEARRPGPATGDEETHKLPEPGAGPDEIVDEGLVWDAIRRCIASALNERQRQVVSLYLEELTHEQIAERLGITEANSRVVLHRAFLALQQCLEQDRA